MTELYIATQLQQNKSQEVLNLLNLIPEEDRNIDTWLLFAKAAIQQKEFPKARFALDMAKLLLPKSIALALTENFYYNNLPEAQPEKALDVISVILATYPQDKKLQVLYIRQLISLKKFTEADAYVINLKNNFSENIDSQLIAANYYIFQKNLVEAKNLVAIAFELDNKNLQALYSLSKINLIEKNWLELLETYKQIIKLYPTELMAYRGVITSLIKQKKDPLTTSTDDYLPANYQPSLLALTLTNFTLQQGKLDLASSYAKKATNELPSKYQSNLDKLKLQLAFAKTSSAFKEKDFTKAQEIVSEVLKDSPDNINLLTLMTRIKIRLTAYVEAKEIIQKIDTLLPNNSLSARLNSEIFIAQKQPEIAINLLTANWQDASDENIAQVLYPLLNNSNADKALLFLDDWLKEYPESLVAIRYQALHFQNIGNKDKALIIYDKLLQKDPNNIIALNNAAWLYFEQDNPVAMTLAQKAYSLLPKNAAIVDTYGWILYKNGKIEQAKELLQKAILLSPDDIEIQAHLKEVNSKQ